MELEDGRCHHVSSGGRSETCNSNKAELQMHLEKVLACHLYWCGLCYAPKGICDGFREEELSLRIFPPSFGKLRHYMRFRTLAYELLVYWTFKSCELGRN
jgi:hypothetical protein